MLWKGHETDKNCLGVRIGPNGIGFPPFVCKDAEAGSETSCCRSVVFIKTLSVIVINRICGGQISACDSFSPSTSAFPSQYLSFSVTC